MERKNVRTFLLFVMVLVMIMMLCSSCSKGGGAETALSEEAPASGEEDAKAKLSIQATPEAYRLEMSSTPGIRLGITMASKGEPDLHFEAKSGSFLVHESGKNEKLGNKVKRKLSESGAIYWVPDKDTKTGDIVKVSLVDEKGKTITDVNLSVSVQEYTYSLKSKQD